MAQRGRVPNKERIRFWLVYSLYQTCILYTIYCSRVPVFLQFNKKLYKSYIVVQLVFTQSLIKLNTLLFFLDYFVHLCSKTPDIYFYQLYTFFTGTREQFFFTTSYPLCCKGKNCSRKLFPFFISYGNTGTVFYFSCNYMLLKLRLVILDKDGLLGLS